MINHRVTCEAPGCGRYWRENCKHCARDMAERHRRETGHPVELRIVEATNWRELKELTGIAHRMLMLRGRGRGW